LNTFRPPNSSSFVYKEEYMKVSLITGATNGIGEAVARLLAGRKHNILLVARSEEKLKKLCEELSAKHGIQAHYIAADLSKPSAPSYIFEECGRKELSVSILINNAAVGSSGEFVKNNLQSELDMLYLNTQAMVALCSLFLPAMVADKSGTIINIGSLASFFPSPYMAVYAASKAFVRSFTEALTEECRPYNVFVMLFCPGLTSTNFMNTPANDNEWGKSLTAGAYIQTPEQVAAELIRALENRNSFHISGRRNALQIKLATLIPNAIIARIFASRKRKQMGLSV
jgi:short-subunit dehydrogenase